MKWIQTMLFVGVFVGMGCSVQALTADNRYDTITDRNIFRLNTPPPPVVPDKEDPVLDRKVDLSGISNVGGHKKAWFVVASKPGSKDPPLYLNLSEGERQDFLEVVSISENEGEVKVLNSGNSMVLSLKNNSLKPQAVAAAPPAPGAPQVAHTIPTHVPRPEPTHTSYGNTRSSYGQRSSNGNESSANGTFGRGGVTVSGGAPAIPTPSAQQTFSSGLRTIPTRTLRLAPSTQNQPPVDPVTQRVMMEVQQEHARQTGQMLPPLPPLPQ